MQRLRLLDVALLIGFVPLWVLCFALYMQNIIHGRLARIPLLVAAPESADDYPTLRAFWPGTGAEKSGLAIGDRLTRVGEADLRGVGPFGFTARTYEQVGPTLQAPVVFLREGVPDVHLVTLQRFALPWRTLFLSFGFASAAVVVLLRRPGVRVARAFFLAAMTYSFHWTFFAGGPRWQTYAWLLVVCLSALVMLPLWLRFILLLPEELAPPGARLPRWPWLFVAFGPSLTSRAFGLPYSPTFGLRAELVVTIAFIMIFLLLVNRNFRRAGPLGRRQLKWVVYGIYIGTAPILIADAIIGIYPMLWWLHESATVFTALIPLCLLIAIVRFNLFDIDRLISTTAAYSILVLVLGAAGLTAIPVLTKFLSASVGVEHTIGQATLLFMLATVALPGQRYLRPQIERLFFVQRHILEQGMRQLERDVAIQPTIATMLTMAGERLFALLQAESCAIYGKVDSQYVPVFIRGGVMPTAFDVQGPLVGVLQSRAAPVDPDRWRRTVRTSLSRSERTMVENLRAAAVLPIRCHEALVAFVCLGQKRSGDVYTSTDFALLASLGKKMTEKLQQSGEAEVRDQFAVMQRERQDAESVSNIDKTAHRV
ncbi:MAG TPA: hypothetical protein VNN62_21440 [Methylomirabilota bacterium]|jgi:hypothetical protein|nr:hypothetical protein [Methylomirabilota bacterium]